MSTRYVWDRYTTSTVVIPGTYWQYSDVNPYCAIGTVGTSPRLYVGSVVVQNNMWVLVPTQSNVWYNGGSVIVPAGNYFLFTKDNNDTVVSGPLTGNRLQSSNGISYLQYASQSTTLYYSQYQEPTMGLLFPALIPNPIPNNVRYTTTSSGQGSYNATVSSNKRNAYPNGGKSGSYWYTYKGSDNLDPSAVTIPSTINGGDTISISLTPSTGKVYTGTTNYQYSYKFGSGNWTDLATSSNTSYSLLVPEDTVSVQARVRAIDNIGFVSNDYVQSSSVNVINNLPPSAPASISATNVVSGNSATITWDAATDSDGTIASYTVEHKIDGGEFTQIYSGSALTCTDSIGSDWGTVQYRVLATDNEGASSGYTMSDDYTVTSAALIINGPSFSMGEQDGLFEFEFSVTTSDSTSITDVTAIATLDGAQIYSDTPDSGQTVTIPIDTRYLGAGQHVINVTVSKTNYSGLSYSYTFTVPSFTIVEDGGIAQQFENAEGTSIYPVTLARYVIGKNGKDVNALLGDGLKIKTGYYTGTGTFGSTNLNSLTFEFVPKFLIVTNRSDAGYCPLMVYEQPGAYSQVGNSTGYLTMTWGQDSGKTVKWYSTTAELQLNNSGQYYFYVAIG